MSVREILARWPSTRDVFERAGLMGCGGAQGPDERLDFFANVHQAPLDGLKRALGEAIRHSPAVRTAAAKSPGRATAPVGGSPARRELAVAPAAALVAEPAHRYVPFLLASVALTLTFGATLGMVNLARLTTPYFGGMPTASVRAHAFAQVFGFVGLFVMGIACHVLPRFAGRPLAAAWSTRLMLGLQAGGVLAIVAALMLGDAPIRWAWIAGSTALVAAGSMFLVIVARTIVGLPATERFRRWVIAGATWQVAAAAGSVAAAWQNDAAILQPLWSAALWGFAGSWIFGVGRRIFPGFLGWQVRAPRLERPVFVLYQTAVVLTVLGGWPHTGEPRVWAAAGALGLLAAVPLFSWCLGVGNRPKTYHDVEQGYQRYITAAWVWLGAALVAGPLFVLVTEVRGGAVPPLVTDFSRHALAFGFVTQVIMGVATRILPVFTGNVLWSPRARTAAFYLLNTSVVLRSLEAVVALGFVAAAWPFIAFAGPPAAAAVALFALNVVFTIFGRPSSASRVSAAPLPMADRRISEILRIPGALDLLVDAGFAPLKNPVLRATMAGSVTLRQACGLKGVPLDPLVARLEQL